MHINGILIDCSRLMERRDYYYRLIDFMADWKMNVLQLHFCDDHGLGIRLPGFSDIAAPNAFTPREIKALVAYATERGIEIIPELAAFGHIRYLTDHPKYAHLLVGKKSRNIRFNAIDPTNPESKKVIERLLRETVKLFPGPRVHVGCDEVDVAECCEGKENLDPSTLWADYVNSILDLVKKYDRAPLFWADHPVKDSKIRQLLDKDSTAVWWGYTPSVREADLKKLTAAGFKNTIVSPSIACWFIRFLGGRNALTNISKMAKFAANQKSMGVINTIWCPYRYVQGSLYYGLAYGAEAVRAGGKPDLKTFHAKFVR
ncbi:MAG: family 20 glycosylhydrolase, partial [Holophagae bacterium]|nr:family 20 glycosylhydrolase [Holophagae bacterium]